MARLLNENGYAFYLVLSVTTIVFIFGWTALQQSGMQHAAVAKFHKQTMAALAAYSGLERAKANLAKDPDWRPAQYSEQTGTSSQFSLKIDRWGGYIQAVSHGLYVNACDTVAVLLGQQPAGVFANAILLTDAPYGLIVAGQNIIRGNVCMAGTDVKASTDPRLRFTGEEALNGRCVPLDSLSRLEFAAEDLQSYMDFCDSMIRLPQNVDRLVNHSLAARRESDLPVGRVLFIEGDLDIQLPPGTLIKDRTIYVERKLRVSGGGIYDQVRFTVGAHLDLRDSAEFKDCLFYSKGGALLRGGRFESQLLSRDTIQVANSCLGRSSFLFLDAGQGRGVIHFQPGTRSKCFAAVYCTATTHGKNPLQAAIVIDSTAAVNGIVWANALITHRGRLEGMIRAKSFGSYRRPTLYVNWLFDSIILREKLETGFLLPALFGKDLSLETARAL